MEPALVAEDLMGYVPVSPGGQVDQRPWGRLSFQPGPHPYFATVSGVRTDLTAGELLDEAAAFFRSHGRTEFSWWLGPHTRPASLGDDLLGLGAEADEPATAMVLTDEPPPVPGVVVRRVTTKADLALFRSIIFEVDESSPEELRQSVEEGLDESFATLVSGVNDRTLFLAHDADGVPVSSGGLTFTEQGLGALVGGATRPWARGGGLYRALVRARWEHARERGSPALVTQASPMSRPVLERCGFRAVAEVQVLRTPCT